MNAQPEHVALFLPSLTGGGAERVMINLARGMVRRGIRVDLVVARAAGPYLSQVPEGVRLVELGRRRVILCVDRLAAYLRWANPDILLSALHAPNVVAVLASALTGTRCKVVVTVHNSPSKSFEHGSAKARLLMLPVLKRAYAHADHVVSVSEGVRRDLGDLLRLPSELLSVVYNPIVDEEVAAKASEPVTHPWFREEGTVILGIGRLIPQKDFFTLLEAFRIVRGAVPARLVILGEGPQREQLVERAEQLGIRDSVAFPGFVDNPFSFLANADVFALSSAWEGFGNVIVEALAVGTPVVSTACPSGPDEILENGRYGRLVPVGDVQALAAALLEAIGAPAPEEVLIARAADFHVDTIVDRYIQLMTD